MSKLPSVLLAACVAASLSACAHSMSHTTTTQGAPATARSTAPALAPSVASTNQTERDLDALARGTVVRFGFNDDALTPDSQTRLADLAAAMRATPAATLRISGNCDERGTEEYNIALGQRRADVAKAYLVKLGVDEARVATVSFGYEHPVALAHSEAAWAENRRDDVTATHR